MANLPFLTLNSTVDDLRTTTNNLNVMLSDVDSDLGDRTSLNSSNKATFVDAYNELRIRVDGIDSATALNFDSAFSSVNILIDRADSNDANFVTRVRGSISAGGDISYNPATGIFSIDVEQIYTKANFDSDLNLALDTNAVTTTDLTEGTNLYYTTTRVNSAFDTRLATKTTTDLAEGTNLYYTDGRFDTRLATKTTTNLTEGTNQYFTQARARSSISIIDAGGDGSLSYSSSTGVITYTGPSAAEVRAHVSAVDAGGDGSFTYNSSTGAFTYTGPSASEVRAHFSEGEGINISSGVISGEDASTTNKGIASFNSSRFSVSSGAVDIADYGIINSKLANSSFILNGVGVSLGQNITANMTVYNIYPAAHNSFDLGASGTRFRTMYAGTFNGTATSAQYADLAEKYLADEDYPVGTVMSVGGVGEVTATTMYSGHSILGVVSENPAFMMNEGLVGGTYIALKGRVPVRITGQVRKGDRLAPSPERGVAQVDNDRTAWSFAIALHDTKEGEDTVEAVIL